jgi:glycerophosphoryl diester phosphodiesterase
MPSEYLICRMPAVNLWLAAHDRPLIIGHRGASAHAPENTLLAFQTAREHGADGVELDVTLCASGEVVVIHDDTVDRTTDGKGRVRDLSLAALRRLDAGQGQRIPTLDEVIAFTADWDPPFLLNIELKPSVALREALAAAVVDAVWRGGCAARTLFSSFDPLMVRRLAQLAPEVPRGILYHHAMPAFLRRVWLALFAPHQFRHPDIGLVTPEEVRRLKAQGKRVNTWTVNAPDQAAYAAGCGVHGIISDSPRAIRPALG